MGNKYTKEELFKVNAIEVYKLVLQGREIKRFPRGFWQQPEALNNAELCVKFMIEETLKWTEEDIKEKLSQKTFIENKLSGMLQYVFKGSPYDTMNSVYPNKFKEWELKTTPQGFWTLENGIEVTKWLIEEKLKWTDKEIKENLSQKIFKENKLSGVIWHVFNQSPYNAINSVYPNKFKPWDFKSTPMNYWTLETGREATKWLIEGKLKWTDEEIKENLSQKIFKENNLYGMLQQVFNNSPYDAINSIYPNKFKHWEFKKVPRDFWTLETSREVTKWLMEEKLKWTDEDIKERLSQKSFIDNNLGGMLSIIFNNSPYNAINTIYPNKFKEWELKSVPQSFWTLETGIEATKWLIEKKLKWTDKDIEDKLSARIFRNNNLSGMLYTVFNQSPHNAINAVYPNRFKKEDLKSYRYNFTKK